MKLGFAKVENGAVITHRDSFLLSNITVISVRRPFLAGSMLISAGLIGFGVAFGDLLYLKEIAGLTGTGLTLLLAGIKTAQLSLLSRDLKGTELSSAIWGTHGDLQNIRRDIVEARMQLDNETSVSPERNERGRNQ